MKYLKLNEDGSIDYPYTSFPEDLSLDLLAEYNIYMVYRTSHGDDYKKELFRMRTHS